MWMKRQKLFVIQLCVCHNWNRLNVNRRRGCRSREYYRFTVRIRESWTPGNWGFSFSRDTWNRRPARINQSKNSWPHLDWYLFPFTTVVWVYLVHIEIFLFLLGYVLQKPYRVFYYYYYYFVSYGSWKRLISLFSVFLWLGCLCFSLVSKSLLKCRIFKYIFFGFITRR